MQAMNKFGAVVTIGSLILGACVVTSTLFLTPADGLTGRSMAYSGHGVAQPIAPATQDKRGFAGRHVGPGAGAAAEAVAGVPVGSHPAAGLVMP